MKKKLEHVLRKGSLLVLGSVLFACSPKQAKTVETIYEPTWESLAKHNSEPEWFKDAKLGIYFHWGVYSVPAFQSEWYPAWMYYTNLPKDHKGAVVHDHHVATYGADFDYHDFIPQFTAENFDAADWAGLFEKAGARFAGLVAQHHDGFAMWDSKINHWNAAEMGPHKDITGELLAELKKRDIKTITTFHHARNLQRYANDSTHWANSGNVGNDSHFAYDPNAVTSTTDEKLKYLYGNIPADEFYDRWLGQVNEVVDQYAPDMIWFDSWLDKIPEEYREKMLAHHYNAGESRGQEPIAFYKQEDLPDSVALIDIEQGGKTEISDKYWLTDITISDGSWCYTNGLKYKKADLIIRNMIDVWSKKGVVLLNVSPMANGIIPQEQRDVLLEIGDWIKRHEEAVYNTRAHSVFGYGIAEFEKGHFGGQSATMKYSKDDVRFSKSKDGNTLYVYLLGMPDANQELELEHVFEPNPGQNIKGVRVVGSSIDLKWSVVDDKLKVTTPEAEAMDEIATVLKVEFI
ncbi:alpha-L-fucosidase [Mangrovibacterium diazotrophicum]|uniref:alpha-L-fucosidase n=1 Tax=Mangrovibacterium diazotrophicum TaxID=1261403 RepID=A0A419W808_9BACT|nr:alpha-L-fucosidase [Mangrovibacterium diazotrophicum]RKD91492.1 alpha-L-fucosidase [Mangrovibacterium diazotrophicum]